MSFLRYVSLTALVSAGLFAALPAIASASTLYVDLEIDNSSHNQNYDPSDFTVEVWGDHVSPKSFKGTDSGKGKKVTLDQGYYSVSVVNTHGYTPRYSSGCADYIDDHDTNYCTITMSGSNSYYPPNYNQNYQYPYNYTQPTTYYYNQPTLSKGYVPAYLPNTGFPPVSSGALALALVMLLGAGFFLYPHVRKAFTAVLR